MTGRGESGNLKKTMALDVEAGHQFIPVAEPALVGNEKLYVNDCLDSTWISSNGKYVQQFEGAFAEFCDVDYAISSNNGTAAVHLALLALGVGPGDEIISPTLTFVATANAITYCGATPVFVDSEPDTWNLDPKKLEEKITERTRAIIVVHLYGHPVDMDPVMKIANRHGLFVIEDAAEAHGAKYKDQQIGSIGDLATFSFYGNKVITTGEGGMVVTKDRTLAQTVRQLKGQGQDFKQRYWFPIVGYNYRMTNIQAAIGLAQLEQIEWHLARRRDNAMWYKEFLGDCELLELQPEMPWAKNVYWMNNVILDEAVSLERDDVMAILSDKGIGTRSFFYPMHTLPIYIKPTQDQSFPVADTVAARGISLPSSAKLSRDDVAYVSEHLLNVIRNV